MTLSFYPYCDDLSFFYVHSILIMYIYFMLCGYVRGMGVCIFMRDKKLKVIYILGKKRKQEIEGEMEKVLMIQMYDIL